MKSTQEQDNTEARRFQRRLFGFAIGTFFVPLLLLIGLVAWRDYREGDWDSMIFVLLFPIFMALDFLKDWLVQRQIAAERLPKSAFWRGMTLDFFDKSTFLALLAILCLWQDPVEASIIKTFAVILLFVPLSYTALYALHLRFPKCRWIGSVIRLPD